MADQEGQSSEGQAIGKEIAEYCGCNGHHSSYGKAKVTRPRKGPLGSGVTGIRSQVHSQASTQVQSCIQIGSRSYSQKSLAAFALPSKKRALVTKANAAPRSKKNKLLSEEELSTNLASAMSELPKAPRIGKVIDYNNVNIIFQKFFTEYQNAFVFNDLWQKMELDVMRLVNRCVDNLSI